MLSVCTSLVLYKRTVLLYAVLHVNRVLKVAAHCRAARPTSQFELVPSLTRTAQPCLYFSLKLFVPSSLGTCKFKFGLGKIVMLSAGSRHHVIEHILLILVIGFVFSEGQAIKFSDTSIWSGLVRTLGKRKKYGGASIADLDGDGALDLILCHHDDKFVELYWGKGNGAFIKSYWNHWNDAHAQTPMRFSAWQKQMHFLMSQVSLILSFPINTCD